MPISPKCVKCKQELQDFGAILLSPPDQDDKVIKPHLCRAYYKLILPQV